jgi:hypothetical protein
LRERKLEGKKVSEKGSATLVEVSDDCIMYCTVNTESWIN